MDSFESFVQKIIVNAKTNILPNGVAKNLTYQQAVSIATRSDQLTSESNCRPNRKNFDRQIDDCYRQREYQLRNEQY